MAFATVASATNYERKVTKVECDENRLKLCGRNNGVIFETRTPEERSDKERNEPPLARLFASLHL